MSESPQKGQTKMPTANSTRRTTSNRRFSPPGPRFHGDIDLIEPNVIYEGEVIFCHDEQQMLLDRDYIEARYLPQRWDMDRADYWLSGDLDLWDSAGMFTVREQIACDRVMIADKSDLKYGVPDIQADWLEALIVLGRLPARGEPWPELSPEESEKYLPPYESPYRTARDTGMQFYRVRVLTPKGETRDAFVATVPHDEGLRSR